eukprot:11577989-Heterocapsa_arctica.AAC.1
MLRMLSAGAGRFALRVAGASGAAGTCLPRSESRRIALASSPSTRRRFPVKSETVGAGRGCVARSPRS